jgi:conserved hypothetical protein, proteobacterial
MLLVFSVFSNSALAKFSGKVALASDYIWRGVSQTKNRGAVQGEIFYDILDSGLYVGVFGSNVNFGEELGENGEMPPIARVEFNYMVGYSHDFNEDWGIDIGVTQYEYPGATTWNYREAYGSIKYKFLVADFAYSNDNFGTRTTGYYGGLGAKYELFQDTEHLIFKDIYANGHAGYFKKSQVADGGNCTDYLLSVIKIIQGVNFEVGWTKTSGRSLDDNLGTGRVFAKISKEF